ncbi:MAG: DNA polymerase IV [Candidatus Eremiobacteraeota bacterium]|nr:DNA polymerase IV [Candidatus Eremiobacteraeota bacterium]
MIAHFDVDAFYASVAVRDDPRLRGKPIAVAGSSRRAVVLTASYEARPFGVHSAMPLYRALQACPGLVVVRPDYTKYRDASRQIFEIFGQNGGAVEGLSFDEAFVDLGDCAADEGGRIAESIRQEVRNNVGLTVSAGVSTAKMVSKIASDLCKPDGIRVVPAGEEAAFLAPLPVRRLWGIGPKTVPRLNARGIETIGQLATLNDDQARALFGSWGLELRELALGHDTRHVESGRETKSISTEETFEFDVVEEGELLRVLREQARELAQSLEREGLVAATIGIKVKRADFSVIGRQTHLEAPARDEARIFEASSHCLRRADLNGTPVRLLGTRCATLLTEEPRQTDLFG